MKTEKIITPVNGYAAVVILLITAALIAYGFGTNNILLAAPLLPVFVFVAKGLMVIGPNSSKVLLLFGNYKGSVKQSGLLWVNPFYSTRSLSLRARNFESEVIKVNDKTGNPILISVILVWKVKDTFKSLFEVDKYENFIKIQTDSAVRKACWFFSIRSLWQRKKEQP